MSESRRVDILNFNFFDWDGVALYKGGAERYIYDLSLLLKGMGWSPRILQRANRAFLVDYRGIPVVGVEITGEYNFCNLSARYAELCKDADLVIASPLELACKLYGLKVIGINHGIHWDNQSRNLRNYHIQNYQDIFDGLEIAHTVVAVDTNFINWVRTYSYSMSRKIKYLPNYFDAQKFRPADKDFSGRIRVLYPRRLYAPRGVFLVFEAFEYLLSTYRFLELHLVGQADAHVIPIVNEFIKRFPNQVIWEELDMDEMYQAYEKSHIVIIPTMWAEGTSLSCIEGMATNNAIIATNVGGLPNLVIDGYNGLLISPTSQELQHAVEYLLHNRYLISKLASNGLEVAKAFEKKKWEERWTKVIKSATEKETMFGRIPMAERIFIAGAVTSCWWNAGDEAIFSSMIQTFRSQFPGIEIGVLSANPTGVLANTYQVRELPVSDIQEILEFAKESDALILGGGGIFYDYWGFSVENLLSTGHGGAGVYVGFALLASLLNKPLMIYAVGVGPLHSTVARQYTYLTFKQAKSITVRDLASKKLLSEIGIPSEKVQVTADPAWLLPDISHEVGINYLHGLGWDDSSPVVGVVVRPWENFTGDNKNEWETEVAQALDTLIEKYSLKVLFVPFHKDNNQISDYEASKKVLMKMKYGNSAHVVDGNWSLDDKISILRCCSLVVGMRLHANILAMRYGIPVVGLAYDPKVSVLFDEVGLSNFSIDLRRINALSLFSILDHAYRNREELKQLYGQIFVKISGRALQNLDELTRILKPAGTLSDFSLPADFDEWIRGVLLEKISMLYRAEKNLSQLQHDNNQLRHQNSVLQTQLDQITSSLAWKVCYRLSRFFRIIVPYGSRREKILKMMVRAIRLAQHEGLVILLRTVIRKIVRHLIIMYRRFSLWPDLTVEQFEKRILVHRAKYKGIFIQEPVLDWSFRFYQRPQHIATALAKLGYLVIYRTHGYFDVVNGFRQIRPNLWLTNMLDYQVSKAVFSIYSGTAYMREKGDNIFVYEYVDHIDSAIIGNEEHVRRVLMFKEFAFQNADFVIATSRALEQDALQTLGRERVLYIPNGVDVSHYRDPKHKKKKLPKFYLDFRRQYKFWVGYFGAVAPWLWHDVLRELFHIRSDIGFVFIGADYNGGLNLLPRAKNLLYVGHVDYQDLPAYARLFDVCFIPFAPGEIARTTSPLKLFEYFALEKPVVVTSFMDECTVYEEVFSGDSAASLSSAIDAALAIKDNQEYKNRLSRLADKNSWDERAKEYERFFSRIH